MKKFLLLGLASLWIISNQFGSASITGAFVAPPGGSYGPNLLSAPVAPGREIRFNFDTSAGCIWDVLMENSDGDQWHMSGTNICAQPDMIF